MHCVSIYPSANDTLNLNFIKNLKNNALKKLKFKKMILLLTRIGIISALVILLARPVTKGFMPGWVSAELDSCCALSRKSVEPYFAHFHRK